MTGFYVFTKLFTLPGSLLRAFWQQVVCRICHIPVEDSRYLRTNEMCGHIEHEFAVKPRSAFAICYVPMFFNILLAIIVGSFSAFRLFYLGEFTALIGTVDIIAVWFAFSLLTNCAPLKEDAIKMWSLVYSKQSNVFQKIFYTPGAVLCRLWATLDVYGIHFLLGIIAVAVLAVIPY